MHYNLTLHINISSYSPHMSVYAETVTIFVSNGDNVPMEGEQTKAMPLPSCKIEQM